MGRRKLEATQVFEIREKMTQAAVLLYRQGGVEAITFRELGLALGVSHVTPYRYFDSKDDLLAAVRTAVFADFDACLREADVPALSAPERLRRIWRAMVHFAQDKPADYRLLFGLMLPDDGRYQPLREARASTLAFVSSVYADGVQQGTLHGDTKLAVPLMFSTVHGMISLQMAGQLVEAGATAADMLGPVLDALLPQHSAAAH